VRLGARLRAAGIGAEVFPEAIPLGKQLGYGSSRGYKLAVIVGPDEQANQVFNLRNLATRQEDKGLAWSVLEDSVQSALEAHKHQGAGL
jgi:histidyl-tRNA synthetase